MCGEKVVTLIFYVGIGVKNHNTENILYEELSASLICLIGSVSINNKSYCRKIDNIHQGPSNIKPYDMYGHIA